MKAIIENDTIQIEITNACLNNCSNCTRFVGHTPKPFFMTIDQFKRAVDSLKGFPHMVGIMGGEPLLHSQFQEMCEYLSDRFPPEQCGLWTCLPASKIEHRELICKTFGNIFVNDHTRSDIYHHPFLISALDIDGIETWRKWHLIEKCPFQQAWSASINPAGAFFCEIAASITMLFLSHDIRRANHAWEVKPGWWKKTSKDYREQMESACMLCGGAMPLKKKASTDFSDEIGPFMLSSLSGLSPKIKKGNYLLSDCEPFVDTHVMAAYKDQNYRDNIAARYGIYLVMNSLNFLTPKLSKSWNGGDINGQKEKL